MIGEIILGGNKLKTYRLFKHNFSFELYVLYWSEEKRKLLTKLRISAHKLEIKQGRYHNSIYSLFFSLFVIIMGIITSFPCIDYAAL